MSGVEEGSGSGVEEGSGSGVEEGSGSSTKTLYVRFNYSYQEYKPDNFDYLFYNNLEYQGYPIYGWKMVMPIMDYSEPFSPETGDNGFDYAIRTVAGVSWTLPSDYFTYSDPTLWTAVTVDSSLVIPEGDYYLGGSTSPDVNHIKQDIDNQAVDSSGSWSFDLNGARIDSFHELYKYGLKKGIEEVAKMYLQDHIPSLATPLYNAGHLAYTLYDINGNGISTLNNLLSNFDTSTYSAADVDRLVTQLFYNDLRKLGSELKIQLSGAVGYPKDAIDKVVSAFTGMSVSAHNLHLNSPNDASYIISVSPPDGMPTDPYVRSGNNGYTYFEELPSSEGSSISLGGLGDDVVNGYDNTDSSDILVGGDGNDKLSGWSGNDILAGGDGDDQLYNGKGNDQFDGGLGNDTIFLSGNYFDYTISTSTGIDGHFKITDKVYNRDGIDDVSGIEYFNFADVEITADALTPTPTEYITYDREKGEFYGNAGSIDTMKFPGYVVGALGYEKKDDTWSLITRYTTGETTKQTLHGIERLEFINANMALDVASPTQSAGSAVALWFAYYDQLPGDSDLGNWIAKADQINDSPVFDQNDLEELAQSMLTSFSKSGSENGSGSKNSGISNTDLVTRLYTNIVGTAPSSDDLNYFTQLIETGVYTQAGLFAYGAAHELNTEQYVDLIGGGLQYVSMQPSMTN